MLKGIVGLLATPHLTTNVNWSAVILHPSPIVIVQFAYGIALHASAFHALFLLRFNLVLR